MWHIYIIQGKDNKLYTGITTDLERRLKEHNAGRGCRYTKFRAPFKLRYAENAADRSTALKREARIKRLSRKEKLSLLLSA